MLSAKPPSQCLNARNMQNAQYTVRIGLGTPPQMLWAVPDTGSYELLAASTWCEATCARGHHTLFDPANSSTFHKRRWEATDGLVYGQGCVLADRANESITLGAVTVPNQSFLAMTKNGLMGWAQASYDAVMGIGPLQTVSPQSRRPSFMTSLGYSSVGICYGLDSPGRVDFGGRVPGLTYTTLPAIGEQHWALQIDSIVAYDGAHGSGSTTDEAGPCAEPPHCAAVVDSGTSLIALPSDVLSGLSPVLNQLNRDCSNVDSLPSIRFGSGAHSFELTASQWVIKARDVPQARC